MATTTMSNDAREAAVRLRKINAEIIESDEGYCEQSRLTEIVCNAYLSAQGEDGWQPIETAQPQEDVEAVDILNVVPIKTKPGHPPVNLPFERLPQSEDDPGFGPLPLDRENIASPVDKIERGPSKAAVEISEVEEALELIMADLEAGNVVPRIRVKLALQRTKAWLKKFRALSPPTRETGE